MKRKNLSGNKRTTGGLATTLKPVNILLYLLGMFVMGLGIVLIKKAQLGMSPIASIPNALSSILFWTFGRWSSIFQGFCCILIILIEKKFSWKALMTMVVAFGFGFIMDFYVKLLAFSVEGLIPRILLCLFGIVFTALGIVMIRTTNLVLPSPDELLVTLSKKTGKPHPTVKIIGDVTWVFVTVILELVFLHRIGSVGIGTVLSMFLTGVFVGRITKIRDLLMRKIAN